MVTLCMSYHEVLVVIGLKGTKQLRLYRWFNSEVVNLQKVGFEIIAFSWKNDITWK